MKKLFFVLLIAGGAGFGMLQYHFILFDNSLKVLKKTDISVENTFVDARGKNILRVALKPDLISAGIKDVISQLEKKVESKTGQ